MRSFFSKSKVELFLRFWPLLVLSLLGVLGYQLLTMDRLVREKFEGKRWKLPSVVYARPLEIFEGAFLAPEDLKFELHELGYVPVPSPSKIGEYSQQGDAFLIKRHAFAFLEGFEDSVELSFRLQGKKVFDLRQNGAPSKLSRLEPLKVGGIYSSQKKDRKLVQLHQVPTFVTAALIAIEDRDFYDHWGISFKGIGRAMWSNMRAGRFAQGGSTLTQQLVKNFYLTPERSLKRKGIEAVYSVLLEWHYSKDEILETYLNEIYMGHSSDNGIHGFGLASEFYFGRPLESISLAQAALLAAIANGPSHFNPSRNPERAKKRRNLVLELLLEEKKITKQAYALAIAEPCKVLASHRWMPNRFPSYIDLVRRHLDRDFDAKDLAEDGLRIFSSFDPITQIKAEEAIAAFMKGQGPAAKKLQVAAVTVSESGEVQAVIGDKVPGYQGFNRALDAKRSIGSLAKPVVLLAAVTDPSKYTLASMISDEAISIPLSAGQVWEPQNFDHTNHGTVSLLTMLTQSYNRATVRLGSQVGLGRVRDTFKKLSGREDIPEIPSIMLGSLSMSPYEVSSMYYPLFSGGNKTELISVRAVQNHDGKILPALTRQTKRIYESSFIHLVQYAMRAVVFEGTARAAFSFMPYDLTAAGKTGTSNDQRDSWFAGFTGDKLTVAWVGNDSNDPTQLTGSSGGLHVWAQIMAKVSHKALNLAVPASVQYRWVDRSSGMLTSADCQGARSLPFVGNSGPQDSVPCPEVPESLLISDPKPMSSEQDKPLFDWFFKLMQ